MIFVCLPVYLLALQKVKLLEQSKVDRTVYGSPSACNLTSRTKGRKSSYRRRGWVITSVRLRVFTPVASVAFFQFDSTTVGCRCKHLVGVIARPFVRPFVLPASPRAAATRDAVVYGDRASPRARAAARCLISSVDLTGVNQR